MALTRRGFFVAGCGRRANRLKELEEEVGAELLSTAVVDVADDDEVPTTTMAHNGISYGLYEGKACGGCGADNWRGEKIALAHDAQSGGYLCPPCVNAYLAKKGA